MVALPSLIPRSSPPPVFDHLQVCQNGACCKRSKTGAGEGLGTRLVLSVYSCMKVTSCFNYHPVMGFPHSTKSLRNQNSSSCSRHLASVLHGLPSVSMAQRFCLGFLCTMLCTLTSLLTHNCVHCYQHLLTHNLGIDDIKLL